MTRITHLEYASKTRARCPNCREAEDFCFIGNEKEGDKKFDLYTCLNCHSTFSHVSMGLEFRDNKQAMFV